MEALAAGRIVHHHSVSGVAAAPEKLSSFSSGRRRARTATAARRDDYNSGEGEQQEYEFAEDEAGNWDKAWSRVAEKERIKQESKQGHPLFKIDMEQYVNRQPVYRQFPLSEEVDPFRRTERSNLRAWNDPKFTFAGFGVVAALFVYMVMNAPPHA